tara:strand:- start:1471 stop:1650 length:180 start_codon:yes stop_codon:yes gene_type:complete
MMLGMVVSNTSGLLNPDWVESYLMGYPLGWTNPTYHGSAKEFGIVNPDSQQLEMQFSPK